MDYMVKGWTSRPSGHCSGWTTALRIFADENVAYVHMHNARRGCYACRVDRG